MAKTDTFYLEDITKAIEKITLYLVSVDSAKFEEENMRQDAVIRQLEIIGSCK